MPGSINTHAQSQFFFSNVNDLYVLSLKVCTVKEMKTILYRNVYLRYYTPRLYTHEKIELVKIAKLNPHEFFPKDKTLHLDAHDK